MGSTAPQGHHHPALRVGDDGTIGVEFGVGDWLGPGTGVGVSVIGGSTNSPAGASSPGRVEVRTGTVATPGHGTGAAMTLELTAPDGLDQPAGGSDQQRGGVADVRFGIRFEPARRTDDPPEGLRAFGHQHTEFGLPTQASEALDRWFLLPMRPPIVWPLWLCAADGRTVLLAPIDTFHEQVIVVPTDDPTAGIVWGWHGDLDTAPAGFSSTLGLFAGDSPRRLLDQWASVVPRVPRLPHDHDALGRCVSYWTDNGAAYWYKTEPPRSVAETVADAVRSVEDAGVTVGSVQLDSWFYPHRTTRPFDTDEWVVPPSGLVEWEPRADILPDGIGPLRAAVEDRPLITHCRHLSSDSPYVEAFDCWVDGDYAHPTGPDYYEAFLDRGADWGVETFEHDWLVECWFGVRGLRAGAGRADAWQRGIDAAAAERDMTLQWCMATPADFAVAASLPRVTSIRTSGDHGYIVGPGFLWAWFCYSNALARTLGLAPFKDVFLTGGEHAEAEALLSALSTGPVGVGDAIGTTEPAAVAPTCRADGVIIRPDVPIAAVDACFREHAVARAVPLVAECHTDHAAGRWTQVFVANTYRKNEPVTGLVDLGPSWPDGTVVAVDLRTGHLRADVMPWSVDLLPGEWTHTLLAPVLAPGLAVFGDLRAHAPVGRARIAQVSTASTDGGSVVVEVVAVDQETVVVSGWAPVTPDASVDGTAVTVDHDPASGRWDVTVDRSCSITIGSADGR